MILMIDVSDNIGNCLELLNKENMFKTCPIDYKSFAAYIYGKNKNIHKNIRLKPLVHAWFDKMFCIKSWQMTACLLLLSAMQKWLSERSHNRRSY